MGTIFLIVVGILVAAVLGLCLFGERWRPIRPSTWKLVRESGLRRLLNLATLHTYIYSRWLNQYIKLGVDLMHTNLIITHLGSRTKKWLANEYHAKVLTQEEAESIITVDQEVQCDLDQIVPYSMARDLVLKGPPDVAVYECACRHARANPLPAHPGMHGRRPALRGLHSGASPEDSLSTPNRETVGSTRQRAYKRHTK